MLDITSQVTTITLVMLVLQLLVEPTLIINNRRFEFETNAPLLTLQTIGAG